MPHCRHCSNETRFLHDVRATEERVYDGNEVQTTEIEVTGDTEYVRCAECGSSDVVFYDDEDQT